MTCGTAAASGAGRGSASRPVSSDLWAELTGGQPVRRKRGRPKKPPHIPDEGLRQRVAILVYLGTAAEIIADDMGIGLKMLREKYRRELAQGRQIIAARIGVLAVEKALAGDRGMLGALTRAGGIGKADDGSKGKDDGNEPPIDFSALPDEDLGALLAALDGGAASRAPANGGGGDRAPSAQSAMDAGARQPAGKMPRKRS